MTAHRPEYVLWVASRGAVSTCDCHYFKPVRLHRPMGGKR